MTQQEGTARRVAAVHAAPVFMNTDVTIDKVIGFVEQAGREDIDLLVFPETFVPGYPYWIECYPPLQQVAANAEYTDASIEVPGPEIARVQAACARAGVEVVLGISERLKGTRTCFNSQVYIDADGSLLGVHRKLQPTYAERIVWGQGGGATLSVFDSRSGRVGGLACWEHTMNLARQALIEQGQQIHAAAWPALSTMAGFETVADAQIEAMMKTHALTAQVFVVCASNPVDDTCLNWMRDNLGEQNFVTAGGGWSAVIHPFNSFLGGPHTGEEEKLVTATVDFSDVRIVKAWVDSKGHYARPEVLRLGVDRKPLWHDEREAESRRTRTSADVTAVIAPEIPGALPQGAARPDPQEWDASAQRELTS
ncbi:Predicted amidohydrolase [Saccharopolyspora antimicrobica]|uniref:Amidohydrolase n=1 Tax=Saccharopolyspora antimicrobica TaxID=455193 RepID=A0A1I5GU83_9PSEU|nr:carbon-nitrogen hydrolase family protein [Saccharopolyspora antimicrobica]RKT87355.1 putative amidohydrolase [Saccharopolyspora antimicrobica]SFO39453.1 Predicted amidohydrolase [Saccharopolyspora antimicrobica]